MENRPTQEERTWSSVRDEQKELLTSVATHVSTIVSNSQLSLKGMRRVLNAYIHMDDKERLSKLNDLETILLSALSTHREELVKLLAIEHALERSNKES